jgi:hypothetical protein
MEERIAGALPTAVGTMLQTSGSPAAITGNVANLYRGQTGAINDLNVKAAQNYQNNQVQVENRQKS